MTFDFDRNGIMAICIVIGLSSWTVLISGPLQMAGII